MTTTIGLGILLLMQGNARELLDANQSEQKSSPEYVSVSKHPYDRCKIYHTMGYGNLLYQELISLSFKTNHDIEAIIQPLLSTYADSLSKSVGKEAAVRVIDHVFQALPDVDHKAWAAELLKNSKQNGSMYSVRSRERSNVPSDEERLVQFEKQSKDWSAERVYHLLAKKAELLGDTNRKCEVIEQLFLASSNSLNTRPLKRNYVNLIRDLNLMGTPAPAVKFGDVLDEKRIFQITRGKVVVLISSTSRGASEWSRAKAKLPDLYEAHKSQGLEVFTLIPPRDGVDKRYRDAVAQYKVDYGIQWPIVQTSLSQLPIIQTPRDNGIFFHPSSRSQLTIIDRKGVIRYVITENSDYRPGYPIEKVKEKLVQLLAEELKD